MQRYFLHDSKLMNISLNNRLLIYNNYISGIILCDVRNAFYTLLINKQPSLVLLHTKTQKETDDNSCCAFPFFVSRETQLKGESSVSLGLAVQEQIILHPDCC